MLMGFGGSGGLKTIPLSLPSRLLDGYPDRVCMMRQTPCWGKRTRILERVVTGVIRHTRPL